jgi:hypothetical protein
MEFSSSPLFRVRGQEVRRQALSPTEDDIGNMF